MAARNSRSIELDSKALRDTVEALRQLDPSVLKELGKDLRRIVGQLRGAAQDSYNRQFRGGTAYVQRVTLGKRKVRAVVMAKGNAKARAGNNDWSDPGVKAAVMEFYGKNGAKTPQAKGTRVWLQEKYGSPGRILWDAWDQRKAELQLAARNAVTEAERTANRRLMGRA